MKKPALPWLRITAEFVVIFAGITLSLLADDWRQGLEDRARERQLLADVAADLRRDSIALSGVEGAMRNWDAAALWVESRVEATSVPADSVFHRIRPFGMMNFYQPVAAAYISLRDAGLMHLIEDHALRRAIVEYFEESQPFMIQVFEASASGWDRWYTVSNSFIDWSPNPDGTSMWASMRFGEITRTWPEIMADPGMRGHMDWAGNIGGYTVERIVPVLEANSALRMEIAEYLSR